MTKSVEDSYDAVAELYAQLFLKDLSDNPNQQQLVDEFAELTHRTNGVVLDVGCGPGHVVNYLQAKAVDVVGYDISPGMLAQARTHFPDAPVGLADFTALPHRPRSVGGILARYSVIHADPQSLPATFNYWADLLELGAPVLLFFFAARNAEQHGEAFDHKAVTAYQLSVDVLADQLREAGFTNIVPATCPPAPGARQIDQGSIMARNRSY